MKKNKNLILFIGAFLLIIGAYFFLKYGISSPKINGTFSSKVSGANVNAGLKNPDGRPFE